MDTNIETSIWEADANQGRESKIGAEFDKEFCGIPGEPHVDYVGPVILAGTDGDDYDVLNKVDPRMKDMAVNGELETAIVSSQKVSIPLINMDTNETSSIEVAAVTAGRIFKIEDANEQTLSKAQGVPEFVLTPENKHWILKAMGFKGLGKGRWKHILFDEEIEFNLDGSTLIQLAFAIHKTGYKNAQKEFDQTGTI